MLIGLDIGGTKCSITLGKEHNGSIEITNKVKFNTGDFPSPELAIKKMEEIIDTFDLTDVKAIGISCGGPLNSKTGTILSPPNLPGWDNVKITEHFEKKYNIKTFLQNDANACAMAEWKFGAGKGTSNMVFFTFGTGLGAGLILDGKLYCGASDMAGEAGHIRLCDYGPVGYGKSGSFEGFCSGNGIKQLGQLYALEQIQLGKSVSFCDSVENLSQITAKSIADSAYDGNEDAKEIYRHCGTMLGKGLAVIIDILNPEMIVIGSVFQRAQSLLVEEMNKVLKKECLSASLDVCKIVPAMLTESLGDYAALAVASAGINDKGEY